MRAEGVGGRAPEARDRRGFGDALRREERQGAERRGLRDRLACRGAASLREERSGGGPERAGALPGASEPLAGPAPPASAGGAGRAAGATVALLRSDRLQVEIAVGEELRFGLALGPGGVEIQARASPALERAARADLHAVADRLRRRGIAVARAALAPRAGAGQAGGRGR